MIPHSSAVGRVHSTVTDTIEEEVKAWQNRALDLVYPIVYLDAIRVKVRHNVQIQNRAIYLAIGITMEGVKEVLGMWAADNEGLSSGCRLLLN